MKRKWAISWLFPAIMILLLHTLVPHSHDFISSQNESTTCEHHQHGFWEFVEHLLEQDCGENHLEYYQITFEKEVDVDNNSLIINILPQFTTNNHLLLIKKTFPTTDYNLKNPFLLQNLTYRGPPFVFN
ncbi:MAG: hypothetical protein AB8G11_07960 [Saprospiraceae bacterium]